VCSRNKLGEDLEWGRGGDSTGGSLGEGGVGPSQKEVLPMQ